MKTHLLFQKYQKEILSFANTDWGKEYLGINTDKQIVKLTPNSWHIWDKRVCQATFYSGLPYLRKFGEALTALELAKQFNPNELIKKHRDFITHPWILFSSPLTTYPDAGDPGTTTVDGYASVGPSSTWAAARDATASASLSCTAATGVCCAANQNVSDYYEVVRSFFLFDTSSITASATISAAIFSVMGNNPTALDNDNTTVAHLVQVTPASNTTLVANDFNNLTFSSGGNTAIAGVLADTYFNITLSNTAWVSQTGVTKLGVINGLDLANTDPGGTAKYNTFEIYFADQATTAKDPKLVVTYTVPASGGMMSFFMS